MTFETKKARKKQPPKAVDERVQLVENLLKKYRIGCKKCRQSEGIMWRCARYEDTNIIYLRLVCGLCGLDDRIDETCPYRDMELAALASILGHAVGLFAAEGWTRITDEDMYRAAVHRELDTAGTKFTEEEFSEMYLKAMRTGKP